TQPLVPAKTIDPVATASETIAEAPAPARALHVSVTTPDAAPLRRRRVRTASQPVVDTALPADTVPVEKPVVEAVVFEGSVADASAAEAQAPATPAAASTAVETPATEAPATES